MKMQWMSGSDGELKRGRIEEPPAATPVSPTPGQSAVPVCENGHELDVGQSRCSRCGARIKMQWMAESDGELKRRQVAAAPAARNERTEKKGPNPFGWKYYSPGLFYSLAFIGSFLMLGILGILFTEPAALAGAFPAFVPLVILARQWQLRGEQRRS